MEAIIIFIIGFFFLFRTGAGETQKTKEQIRKILNEKDEE